MEGFSPLTTVSNHLQLHGKLRVILEPLIGDIPLVGAITMFFIRRPVSTTTGRPVGVETTPEVFSGEIPG